MRDEPSAEALLVRYLLGDLPEEEQLEIEELAFRDQQFMQTIQAVESDLIDEYVRGGLSDCERRQFEGRFFASLEQGRKVEFAKALAMVMLECGGEREKA
jgi:anti-sigma-K factor RskA